MTVMGAVFMDKVIDRTTTDRHEEVAALSMNEDLESNGMYTGTIL
jgi:hypothetical protein